MPAAAAARCGGRGQRRLRTGGVDFGSVTGSICGITGRGEVVRVARRPDGVREPQAPLEAVFCNAKEKSEISDDDSHGTCWPCVPRFTAIRVRLKASSAVNSCERIPLTNSVTNRRFSLPSSLTTVLGADEYITSDPVGASTGASPVEPERNRRSNGLRRDASRIAILTLAPRAFISRRMLSRLTPSRRTSASVQIWPSTGMM